MGRGRLDDIMLDYLFLDASFFRMHSGSPAEPVLAAWGITAEGKVFVRLAPGTGESTDAFADFLTDLRKRGLAAPLLVVSDGARSVSWPPKPTTNLTEVASTASTPRSTH